MYAVCEKYLFDGICIYFMTILEEFAVSRICMAFPQYMIKRNWCEFMVYMNFHKLREDIRGTT